MQEDLGNLICFKHQIIYVIVWEGTQSRNLAVVRSLQLFVSEKMVGSI